MYHALKPVLVAGVLLALGLSHPAAAQNRNGERLLLGLAGVAVLAHVLDRQKKRDAAARAATATPVPVPVDHRRWDRRGGKGRIDYNQCLRQRWTDDGWQTYVDNRCVTALQHGKGRGRWKGDRRTGPAFGGEHRR